MAIRHEVAPVQNRRMTEQEFDRWAMTVECKVEFVDGEVIEVVDSIVSDKLQRFILMLLAHYVEERGLGEVLGPNFITRLRPGLRRCPDAMVLMGPAQQQRQPTYVEGGPSAAIEIVSADSVERDHVLKLGEYEKAGIQEYWLIDPTAKEALFYRLGANGKYRKVRTVRGRFHSAVIPGFWLEVDWLWQDPLPKTLPILQQLMQNVADEG